MKAEYEKIKRFIGDETKKHGGHRRHGLEYMQHSDSSGEKYDWINPKNSGDGWMKIGATELAPAAVPTAGTMRFVSY